MVGGGGAPVSRGPAQALGRPVGGGGNSQCAENDLDHQSIARVMLRSATAVPNTCQSRACLLTVVLKCTLGLVLASFRLTGCNRAIDGGQCKRPSIDHQLLEEEKIQTSNRRRDHAVAWGAASTLKKP